MRLLEFALEIQSHSVLSKNKWQIINFYLKILAPNLILGLEKLLLFALPFQSYKTNLKTFLYQISCAVLINLDKFLFFFWGSPDMLTSFNLPGNHFFYHLWKYVFVNQVISQFSDILTIWANLVTFSYATCQSILQNTGEYGLKVSTLHMKSTIILIVVLTCLIKWESFSIVTLQIWPWLCNQFVQSHAGK